MICFDFSLFFFFFNIQLMKEFPPLTMLNIHENLLESLLELQAYADVQAVLAKYDGEFVCVCVLVDSMVSLFSAV